MGGEQLPSYLLDDAPFAVCGRCGRHTWSEEEFGREDRMTQPDGYPCGGRFSDPSRETPAPTEEGG